MTYESFITELRRTVRDFKFKAEDLFDGDATTAVFILSHHPVIEDSQQILVEGSLKTEVTHYTIDDDLGELDFTAGNEPASGNDNVKATYRYANFNDTDWIDMINDGIEHFGKKFWTEIIDLTTLDTVANQTEYSLSSLSNSSLIFKVVEVFYRTVSSSNVDDASNPWISVETSSNVVFLEDSNKIRISPAFRTAGWDLKIRALRTPTTPTATSDTIDLEDDEIKAVKQYAVAQYYFRMAALKAGDISAISKEPTVSPERVLFQLGQRHLEMAESLAKKVRKPYPAISIPIIKHGISK